MSILRFRDSIEGSVSSFFHGSPYVDIEEPFVILNDACIDAVVKEKLLVFVDIFPSTFVGSTCIHAALSDCLILAINNLLQLRTVLFLMKALIYYRYVELSQRPHCWTPLRFDNQLRPWMVVLKRKEKKSKVYRNDELEAGGVGGGV